MLFFPSRPWRALRETLFLFLFVGTVQAATPPGYAVASAHPLATQAGMEILAAGGNAFDAAVAVSAALTVVEPQSSGIGGGGFWLLHRQSDGFETMVDGREVAPLAATRGMYLDAKGVAIPALSRDGALSAAIPGAPSAWVYLSQKYGSLPLARTLAPAIRYAREGYVLDARVARVLATELPRFSPAAAAIWGSAAEGTRVKQPELADTLEQLAKNGNAGFYTGPVAEKLLAGVKAGGGIWAPEDLSRYHVIERKPLAFFFRDYRIVTAPPPSSGGIVLAESLGMLEALAWPPGDGVQARHRVVEALRRAFRDRQFVGDPDFVAIPLYRLLSRDYGLQLARDIDYRAATPSASLGARPATPEGDNTSHFSILDAKGNRVAGTVTINLAFGSGYMAPGTGVFLNDEMDDFAASTTASNAYGLAGSAANAIAPGKRPLSSMSPTFVEGPRGLLIVGTPGGGRIPTMVLRAILGFAQGLTAAQVVALPRYHHQYLPDQIDYEPGALSESEQAGLNALGHRLKAVPDGYGNMQAVTWDPKTGALDAQADPRGVGAGAVKLTGK